MRDAPRILFAPAAGPQIGGGHVMRDLALAQALHARGATSVFAVPPWGARLVERFGDPAAAVLSLVRSSERALIGEAIDSVRPDALVLDDFSLAAAEAGALRRPGLRIVVIDDLADRVHDADLLADPSYGRREVDYAGLLPPGCRRLCGPAYALLRPGFRRPAGTLPPVSDAIARVFVSFGLSDVAGIAARATARLRARLPHAWIDVALASDAASLPQLAALGDPRLALHPDARDVAPLIAAADLAVGAGGSSTWERFALGAPTLAVIVADNQRPMIRRLAQAGALRACDLDEDGFEAAFDAAVEALRPPAVRERLRAAGLALCDGDGARRVAEAVLSLLA